MSATHNDEVALIYAYLPCRTDAIKIRDNCVTDTCLSGEAFFHSIQS